MGRRRRSRGRNVSGVVVVDKPRGMSSNDAVQRAKRLFNAQKVGHTGSLDPLATGVLPLCFGEATKFSQYLLTSDKRYWAKLKLGVSTASGDADGEVRSTRPVDGVTAESIETALDTFRGEFDQIPSMYSAVKHQGQPLYKLARQGIEVERKSRPVTVYLNQLLSFEVDELVLDIHCSKGTYVRTIAEELGEMLGCGAHVIELRRTMAGPFAEADMVTFDELEQARDEERLDEYLRPISSAVGQWPVLTLNDSTAYYVRQGQPVIVPHAPTKGWVRLCIRQAQDDAEVGRSIGPNTAGDKVIGSCDEPAVTFLGVGEILEDGRVAPRRLVVNER